MVALDSALWAAWVGALGTVAAFMAAAIGFVYNLYATRRDNRAAQARLFDAWVSDYELEEVDGDNRRISKVTLSFSNASPLVIRGVDVKVYYERSENSEDFKWLLGEELAIGGDDSLFVVPPTEKTGILERTIETVETDRVLTKFPTGYIDENALKWQITKSLFLVTRFLDASGTPWQRTPSGKLQKLHLLPFERKAIASALTNDDAVTKRRQTTKPLRSWSRWR
jgi:hypothetical protein